MIVAGVLGSAATKGEKRMIKRYRVGRPLLDGRDSPRSEENRRDE